MIKATNKIYVLSNSESVQCNFYIFDHATFIQFETAAVYKISSKSDDFYRVSAHVRLSVRLSVTFRYQIKTAQHIVIDFSPYVSPIILDLSASNIFTKFRRGPPCGGAKYRWGYKNLSIFYQYNIGLDAKVHVGLFNRLHVTHKNNTKVEMIYNHITPKYTHTHKHAKHLRKFSKIKINLRIVINAFQVKMC